MANFFKTKFLTLFLLSLSTKVVAQVAIISQTYTVCGETLVDIEIRETKSTDFASDPKLQYVTIGFSNGNFKFKDYGYTVNFTLNGGGNGVPTTPAICGSSCETDDIQTDLFTFSYKMTNTEASSGLDVIKITGLIVEKTASAPANAQANIVRIDNTINYGTTAMHASISGSAISDGKSLANLTSPPSTLSLSSDKSSMCTGNNHITFTTGLLSGATYRLFRDNGSNPDTDMGAVTPDASGKFSVSLLIGNTDTRKYYVRATKGNCVVNSATVSLPVSSTTNFAMSADDYYCLGAAGSPITFTVDRINNVKYYLYIDQGGITPDIFIQEVSPSFVGSATTGTFQYTPPATITSGTDNGYYVYTIPTSGTGCNRSSNYEIVKFRSNPTIISSYPVNPKLIVSTAGNVALNDLVTVTGNVNVVFATTGGLNSNVLSVLPNGDTRLNPSGISAGTYTLTAYAEDKDSHCRSAIVNVVIRIIDGSNTLPYFLRNLDRMPICENMPNDNFRLYALISEHCISPSTATIDILVEDRLVVFPANNRKIKATYNPSGDEVLGGVAYYAYEFDIKPSYHKDYAIKIKFDIGCQYDGLIPINPRRDPRLTGLPMRENTVNDHYLCSSSNDSIFMRGNPVGGSYNFYKGILKEGTTNDYDFTPLGTTISPSPAPSNDQSLERFTPSHIYHEVLNAIRTSIIKVVYTVPESGEGSCPDSITKYFHFNPSVDVRFNVAPKLCYGEAVEFNVVYDPALVKDNPNQDRFHWSFGDGFSTSDTLSTQIHDYKAPGLYDVRFKTQLSSLPDENTCNFDTIQSVRIGAKPEVDFLVYKNFIDSTTLFNSIADIKLKSISDKPGDVDSLFTWEYKFGTPDKDHYISHYQGDTSFIFPSEVMKEPYKVTHIVTAKYGCTDSVSYHIPVFPVKVPDESNYSLDTFNINDRNGWFHSGQYTQLANSSWRNVTPNGQVIKEETGNAWVTMESNDTTASYNPNERSWVESPVYDLNNLPLPMVSLNSIVNTDPNYDGVALQYTFCDSSAFGKEIWYTLGNEKSGLNWYNSKLVLGLQKDQLYGWTGKSQKEWHLSAYGLDQIKDSLKTNKKKLIRFRVLFGSNGDNDTEYPYFEGFAFDNFFVGQRNRKIIIEEFCDYQKNDLGDIQGQKLPFDTTQGFYIQYHTGLFTNNDKIFNDNPDEPSARALYYGLGRSLPRGVIDGIFYNNEEVLSKWGPNEFFKRALIVSPFEIDVTANVNSSQDSLHISTTINRLNDSFKERNLLLHVAVVEKSVAANGFVFNNVLRNMVPNAAGTRIDRTTSWAASKQFDGAWRPFITPSSDFNVIAYIQDEDTKEIYQASKVNVPLTIVESLSNGKFGGLNEHAISFNEMSIQPNPVAEDLRVVFNGILASNYEWTITDSYGRVLLNGMLSGGVSAAFIETYRLAPGIYHLTLKGEGRAMVQKFAVVK